MSRRSALLALTLVAGVLLVAPSMPAQADDHSGAALSRLRADADGGLTVSRGQDGRVSFVGTAARAAVENPSVGAGEPPARAARAHLNRYGAAFGGDPASTFDASPAAKGAAGTHVVRFSQRIGDVPVLGGELVVTEGGDGSLRSLAGKVARSATIATATVSAPRASVTAKALVARTHPHARLDVTDQGRWIFDPSVLGLEVPGGARTVRRLEVGGGPGIRELVLIDDHTGQVVFRANLIEELNRVICDDADARSPEDVCSSGFARTEGGAASAVADVNQAYDYAGEVSTFYSAISNGAVDVTQALDIHVDNVPKLASTVRFCTNTKSNGVTFDDPCPFPNAFWDGTQMYYGDGYTAADDVVGHEMTHGIIDRTSRLFYWGQSGAINESLADTMGEFIDHRNGADDDSAWDLGENLPGGAARNMADPTLHQQPDRTSSALYAADPNYQDNGGVHTNSGVGNKTAYLISQGGTFNGQTITGIDTGDATLTKSAVLYLQVIATLPSGADFAQLGDTLQQACATLQTAGFLSAANCTSVHQAVTATELESTPTNASTPADADTSCPVGTTKRVLLDSESNPASKFAPFSNQDWSRESTPGTSNATSGIDSWYGQDPGGSTASNTWIQTDPLRASGSTVLPVGQQSYLSFQNWYLFDYDQTGYYDGGTVEIGVDGGVPTAGSTLNSDWVNGPNHNIASGSTNGWQGLPAFAGDSHGWTVTRLDLTPHAGHAVQPQFTVRTDNQFGFIGWYLDDIQIYTCDVPAPAPGAVQNLSNTGVPRSSATGPVRQQVSWQEPALNAGAVTADRVWVDGALKATVAPSVFGLPLALSTDRSHTITVRAVGSGNAVSDPATTTTIPSVLTLNATRSGTLVTLRGILSRNGVAFPTQKVWIERKSGTSWVAVGSRYTSGTGRFALTVSRSTAAAYRVRFAGAEGVTGRFSPTVVK